MIIVDNRRNKSRCSESKANKQDRFSRLVDRLKLVLNTC